MSRLPASDGMTATTGFAGIEDAPAKINLALHVRRRRDDGYHDLETLFAFTRFGDRLAATEADDWALPVEGQEQAVPSWCRAAFAMQREYEALNQREWGRWCSGRLAKERSKERKKEKKERCGGRLALV